MFALRLSPLRDLHSEMDRVQRGFDQLFGEGLREARPALNPVTFPALNAWEDGESFYVEAELPGLGLEDLEIFMADQNTLTIKGQRKEPAVSGGQWHGRERGFGQFERSLPLPGAVNTDQVEAVLKNGILTVKLPKAPEILPRKVEVKAS
jgi:HSP20 family protein